MISSDPKLPGLIADVGQWISRFVSRFYSLWRELTQYLITLDYRVVTLEDFDFAAGTYTPTLYNTTNVAASTAYACQYLRVGTVVTVSGRVDIDVTTTATDTVLGISLPIASNFANNGELAGTAVQDIGAAVKECGYIRADTTNDRAYLGLQSVGISNYAWYFHFTYQVI